jgi:hypothetical protein
MPSRVRQRFNAGRVHVLLTIRRCRRSIRHHRPQRDTARDSDLTSEECDPLILDAARNAGMLW